MAANPFPNKTEQLLGKAAQMVGGLIALASEVGVTLITEAVLSNAMVTVEAAVRAYEEACEVRRLAYLTRLNADKEGERFISVARNVLALDLGADFSEGWGPTGFPNQSTAVPDTMIERQTLLRSLQNYFANHSVLENAARGVTALLAGVRFHAVADALNALNSAIQQASAAKDARDAAIADLRRKMRGCIDELSQLMEDNDPRWYAFGLNPPAAPDTPEIAEGLEVVLIGPGSAKASWEGAPRADRYRVFKQIIGIDAAPVAVETVYGTEFTFTGLIAGQTIKVFVSAGNEKDYSALSEPVQIVVP
jgi:hypothetical protein